MQPILITIPISHYCEKARWALDFAGISYKEKRHLQIFHMIHTYFAGRSDTVPLLLTDDGIFKDSTDILKWVDSKISDDRKLYPKGLESEVAALEEEFDGDLGVAGRLWMYTYVLKPPHLPALLMIARKHGVPWYEHRLLPIVYPFIRSKIGEFLGVTENSQSESKSAIDATLDRVAKRLQDGRRYLTGDTFTAADLTFAALSAPIIQPKNYGVVLPPLSDLPPEMQDQICIWRAHPAGQFALSLYEDKRLFH